MRALNFRRIRAVWVSALVCCFALLRGGLAQSAAHAPRVASAIAYDRAGNLLIVDASSNQVFEATLAGTLVVLAGSGEQGYSGDGGPATAARLNEPQGIAVGPDGTVYIADTGNHRVRAIDSQGQIRTFAGTGAAGFGGDGGTATLAALRAPTGLAVDGTGAVLVCDTGNQRIRRVEQGNIRTLAGNGAQGFAGDGGPALDAPLDTPEGIAVDVSGNVFLADTHNQRIRKVNAAGVITTIAGTGRRGFGGDGGQAVLAQLSGPRGLAWDSTGNLLIADAGNQRVRAVTPQGAITTLLGAGVEGSSADGAQATAADLRAPRGVAMSSFGMPVVADTLNGTSRILAGTPGLYRPAALAPARSQTTVSVPSMGTMTYGQVSLSAAVAGPVGPAQGSLIVAGGSGSLAMGAISGAKASLAVPGLDAGVQNLTVQYLGDGLNPAAQTATVVQVTPAPVTAIVEATTMSYGAALPTLSGSLVGVLPGDVGAVQPVLQASAGDLAPVGTYPISAALSGKKAANYTIGLIGGADYLSVVKAASVTTLEAPGQAFAGLPVTVSVHVASSGRGQPTGTAQFLDGTNVVATVPLQAGFASAVYPAAASGTRQVAVNFSGDSNFLPSAATPAVIPVLALPDFSVSVTGATTAQVAPGATAKYTVTVASNPAPFTGAVSLSAAGLPAGASVSFSPPQVVPGELSAPVTVAVQTVATPVTAAVGHPRTQQLCFGLVGLLCFLPGSRRKRLLPLCSCCFALSFTGCGARTVGNAASGPVAKTYTVQITGTATNLAGAVMVHTVPVSLTIQQ